MERKELWVYISTIDGKADSQSNALLARAQALAADNGFMLCTVLIGSDVSELARQIAVQGVSKVYVADIPGLHPCEILRCADLLQPLVKEKQPEIFLFPATDCAGLVASTLGVRLKTGVNVHCVSANIRDGIFVGAVPAFGGQVMSEILCPVKKPQMATVRLSGGTFLTGTPGKVIPFADTAPETDGLTLVSVESEEKDGIPLGDAEIVLGGGAGIGDAENWELLKQLAAKLGGAVCCTRSTLDLDCGATEKNMVGVSGSSIVPKIYIGFGISVSAHHICGMKDSGLVLNVNHDENAPFFAASDVGFVGDAGAVLHELLKQMEVTV